MIDTTAKRVNVSAQRIVIDGVLIAEEEVITGDSSSFSKRVTNGGVRQNAINEVCAVVLKSLENVCFQTNRVFDRGAEKHSGR